ncbi:MAG: hypothetical protein PVH63_02580 [Balneolaceae bacterium]|jgi:hypothetical protein
MNTREVIKNVQLVSGGIALLSAAGLTYAITKGLNHRRKYTKPFDPETIEELKGKVIEVAHTDDKKDDVRGVFVRLQTKKDEVIPVHLGPAWYIDRQGRRFRTGEKIVVKGSRTKYNNEDSITAIAVSRGDEILKLRDEDGTPHWRAWSKIA